MHQEAVSGGRQVVVGVHVHAEPERLRATLASLAASTAIAFDTLILPDGPDDDTRRALETLEPFAQSHSAEPRGAAACFNRLVAAAPDADVVVLLESGSIVGPEWLERLLAALDADPRNAIAGPTTNRSWNQQGVFTDGAGTADSVARASADALARFGSTTRTLEPLYSLADFCYAVRRSAAVTIGEADESYGLGPCWEMDYNIRAARLELRGVWACSAYVYRSPFTARRAAEEARRFDASRRRYQDKFCGARLRGQKSDYRTHCRGDACPNFAPIALLRRTADPVPHPSPPPDAHPLVSCIMPTCDRRRFVPLAIDRFLQQDYPRVELIVVDDGVDSIADCLPNDDRIVYVRLERKLTVGAKRNLACARANGAIIVHWDDDDWYPTSRIARQVREIVERGYDVCGSSRVLYFDRTAGRAWEYRYGAAGRPWVAGNTLAYRKTVWERCPFPDWQIGEDAHFLRNCRGARIADLADSTLCAATVHDGNTSRKDTSGAFWQPRPFADVRALVGDDLGRLGASMHMDHAADWPLISCIMPTYNRRTLVPLALEAFDGQDYPNRELLVVDDGEDAVGDLVERHPRVRYFHLPRRTSIGAKRNFACEHAHGGLVAHWDDDDWYSADRLRYQAAAIVAGEADMTGLENAFVLDVPDGRFWTTQPDLHRRMFVGDVHGGTLMFRRQLWVDGLRYPDINLAEDAWFVDRVRKHGRRLLRLANRGVFVYMRHGHNTWKDCVPGRFINPGGWEQVAAPPCFPAGVLASYQAALTSDHTAQKKQ